MAIRSPAVKKSVTIHPETLRALGRERTRNLSATVNESLQLVAALDAQQAIVAEWEAQHGAFTEDELRPFLESAMRAQLENVARLLRERSEPASRAPSAKRPSRRK